MIPLSIFRLIGEVATLPTQPAIAAGTEELLDLVLRIESMLARGVVRRELLVARLFGGRRLDPRALAASCSGGRRSGMY